MPTLPLKDFILSQLEEGSYNLDNVYYLGQPVLDIQTKIYLTTDGNSYELTDPDTILLEVRTSIPIDDFINTYATAEPDNPCRYTYLNLNHDLYYFEGHLIKSLNYDEALDEAHIVTESKETGREFYRLSNPLDDPIIFEIEIK
jgi:hypothetical protein